ncbi:MAG: FIG01006235: hypothetical protein [uncultured Gemmatimonadetes bacterium]|uniref:Uncharacterized protein n=1 Tax=uncultured Gemmatimonadota bacterium TaxID=203437 RepID=A0A6J4M2C6_9BACT|nr:MAG: FIG01006235: hypothetical protein [uncultured Gemmatimonadota bacterium]
MKLAEPEYERGVFINCPFNEDYQPLFEAVLFAVYQCGFVPHSSLEVDDSSQVRIEKITTAIGACRLAVHDISRVELDAATLLPRFNMPLELGIFLGAKSFGGGMQKRKACVILDTERYRFTRFISDIAGQDIRAHEADPARAIEQVRNFLGTHIPPGTLLPSGRTIWERYAEFRAELGGNCRRMRLDPVRLSFRDLTTLITGWLDEHPLPA